MKYNFRMSGELEKQYLSLRKLVNFKSDSSFTRELIKKGMEKVIDETFEFRLKFDQTHGFEITKSAQPSLTPLYKDIEGFYHIPFDIMQEGDVLKDVIDIRDGKKCRKCGKNNGIYYYIDGNENNQTLENIISLCENCEGDLKKFIPKKYRTLLFAIWFYAMGKEPKKYEVKS